MFSLINTAYAAEDEIAVHLAPYVLGYVGDIPITATLLTAWLTMFILVVTAFLVGRKLNLIPSKVQSIFELLLGGTFDYVASTLESKVLAKKYFPVIMTIFIFILTMNWMGLFPGVTSIGIYELAESSHNVGQAEMEFIPLLYPPATDLNITIAFAIIAFIVIEFAGITVLGVWRYGGKFINLSFLRKFNFDNVLGFFIGIIELISELARLIAFSFRLFGNIFAGKVLLLVVMTLATPYLLPVPLLAYELFVGFIQAFVFAILTLFFIKVAIEEPH